MLIILTLEDCKKAITRIFNAVNTSHYKNTPEETNFRINIYDGSKTIQVVTNIDDDIYNSGLELVNEKGFGKIVLPKKLKADLEQWLKEPNFRREGTGTIIQPVVSDAHYYGDHPYLNIEFHFGATKTLNFHLYLIAI